MVLLCNLDFLESYYFLSNLLNKVVKHLLRTSGHKNQCKDIHTVFQGVTARSLLNHKEGNPGNTQADNCDLISYDLTNRQKFGKRT